MSQYTDFIDAIYDITKRPELVSVTASCAKLATLRAHSADQWQRDLDIATKLYTVNTSAQFIDIPSINTDLPQLRLLDLVQGMDATTFAAVENLEWREYTDFWDKDGIIRKSVYTLRGETLRCIFAQQTGRVDIHYYKQPLVGETTYASWICTNHMEELAWWAAGIVFARVGNMDQAKMIQQEHVEGFKALLTASYMTGARV